MAISELEIINRERKNESEYNIVSNHTFSFYRVTLQYIFTMEYCKLMEQGDKGNNNIGSLKKLNKKVSNIIGSRFLKTFEKNEVIIEQLYNSDFFKLIKDLRDTKYAHLDKKTCLDPFSVKGLTDEQIQTGFNHLRLMYVVQNNCGGAFAIEYESMVPSREDRTNNFIKFQANYTDLYFKTRQPFKK